eukprot:scaffold161728_cov66-Cyclotella_meneghiniana.AAC.1
MSATDLGEEFWHDLAAAQNNLDPDASDAWSHADSELCDESDDFTPSDDENQQIDGTFSPTSHRRRRGNEDSDDESQGGAAFDVQDHLTTKICGHLTPPLNQWILKNRIGELPTPQIQPPNHPKLRLRSDAHDIIVNQKAVFLSLDVETGGEMAGIIQLSAEISRIEIEQQGKSFSKDTAERRALHGIHPSDPHIVNASEMRVVWHTFCEWVDSHEPDETIILVAYNGEKCDCKWL